ncbi:hypothetical protein BC829DRAFT_398262, partial [Chytridium lagenaria]
MSMITLKRSGPPPRTFSLPSNRAHLTPDEAALDVRACQPFFNANTPRGSDVFPVRREYVKRMGETVVVARVFRDGWCEGVSRRAGGPACFPVACLGGGVPIVLAERMGRILEVLGRGDGSTGPMGLMGQGQGQGDGIAFGTGATAGRRDGGDLEVGNAAGGGVWRYEEGEDVPPVPRMEEGFFEEWGFRWGQEEDEEEGEKI